MGGDWVFEYGRETVNVDTHLRRPAFVVRVRRVPYAVVDLDGVHD